MKILDGITADTPVWLLLGSGVLLEGFDPDAYEDPAGLRSALRARTRTGEGVLGVTRAPASFRVRPRLRRHPLAGQTFDSLEDLRLEGAEVSLKGELCEVRPENLIRLSGFCRAAERGAMRRLTLPMGAPCAAMPCLTWAGTLGGGLLLLRMDNAVNTEGLLITAAAARTGTLPFTFTAHTAAAEAEEAPFALWLLPGEEAEA